MLYRQMHGLGDARYLGKIANYALVSIDVLLEHLPIIDAGPPRRPGVEEHKPLVDLLGWNGDRFAVNPVGIKMDGVDAAVHRRIVILAAGWNTNQLRLNVLRDHANLFDVDVASHESRQRSRGANHHGGRAGDTRSCRRLRVGLQQESLLGLEEAD